MTEEEKTLDDHWTCEVEQLLAEWSEKASCWRWLYGRSEKKYRYKYYCLSIPVIVLSTLTGTANFGMDTYVPDSHKPMATAIVGGLNLFAGILSTLQNFLKIAENMEASRNSCVSWGKLQRHICIELSLDRSRRSPASDFLKICRSEYDRLTEQSPIVDDDIISDFKSRFKNYDVAKPSICNGLDKCSIYKVNCPDLDVKDKRSPLPEPDEPEPESDEEIVVLNQNIE